MDNSIQILTTAGTVVAVIYLLRRKRKHLNIPGPRGFPLVGNALQLDASRSHLTINDWAAKYGEVMKINLLGEDVVVVNSHEGIMEMLVKKSADFADRPYYYRAVSVFNVTGVLMSRFTPKWSLMKKCCMAGLKQVGDQVTELEGILVDLLDELVSVLTSHNGEDVDIRDAIEELFAKITFTLVFGYKLSREEQCEFMSIAKTLSDRFGPTSDTLVLDILPITRGPWCGLYRELQRVSDRIRLLLNRLVSKAIESYEIHETDSAINGLIKEMKYPTGVPLSEKNIQAAAFDLTVAGVSTSVSILYYFIALLATHPEIQEEAYRHIVDSVGLKNVTLKDKFAIPYMQSMILEVMRLLSNAPLGVPHQTTLDTTLLGYDIPKGTQVWANLWSLHHETGRYEDPYGFKPDRFLDNKGELVTPDHILRNQMFLFGAGRRVCAGETLAKNRIFLITVTLLQRFKFSKPKDGEIVTDPRKFKTGFVLYPTNYKVHIEPRT